MLESYTRAQGIQPMLFALVEAADGTERDVVLPLDDADGAEVLRHDNHPWPTAVASVFVRGYYGDFLAIYKIGETTVVKLIECMGGGVDRFAARELTLEDFEGPLHVDEDDVDGAAKQRAVAAVRAREKIRDQGTCLFTDGSGRCGRPAIKSHSVGRAAHLKRIAANNHVKSYNRKWVPSILGKRERVGDVGIKDASTFRGFCKDHDDHLFRPIDASPIELTQRNAELLGYRAQAYEVFAQWVGMRFKHEHFGMPPAEHLAQNYEQLPPPLRRLVLGWRDGLDEKRTWDSIISGCESDRRARYHFIRLRDAPEVLAATYVCPETDFNDCPLQDLDAPRRAEYIAASILQDGEAGLIALVWLDGPHRVGERLVESLQRIPARVQMDAVVRWVLKNAENVFWSPVWWDALSPLARSELEHLMDTGVVPWVQPLNRVHLVDWQMNEEVRGWT